MCNFTLEEFINTETGLNNDITKEALNNYIALVADVLQPLRNYIKKPIIITSGYRSPAVNNTVGGVSNSQHLKGEAADIIIQGFKPHQIASAVRLSGVPYDQMILESNWLHISYKNNGKNRKEYL